MNPDAILAWQFQPWLSAVAALLSALACHVALELNRRVGGASLRAALPWLAGAALALGTALWSVHFLSLAVRPLHLPVGYGGAVTLAAWVAAVLLGAGALLLAGARRWPRALAPWLLAITAVGVYAACLFDMRLAPAPIWQPLGLLAAVPALALLVAG
ncbi:MAG: MHYT domain-containing protein, partial [Piscinibacter sp.]